MNGVEFMGRYRAGAIFYSIVRLGYTLVALLGGIESLVMVDNSISA